jgi:hypothetical protein
MQFGGSIACTVQKPGVMIDLRQFFGVWSGDAEVVVFLTWWQRMRFDDAQRITNDSHDQPSLGHFVMACFLHATELAAPRLYFLARSLLSAFGGKSLRSLWMCLSSFVSAVKLKHVTSNFASVLWSCAAARYALRNHDATRSRRRGPRP